MEVIGLAGKGGTVLIGSPGMHSLPVSHDNKTYFSHLLLEVVELHGCGCDGCLVKMNVNCIYLINAC